jgi:DNA-binding transcriptional LysR family regulator
VWSDVELREIRLFLTLAEELHFGRTAERLGLTPSRVSQILRTLETRLGGNLFERTSRSVRLTPLGERLRERLEPTYAALLHAVESTHQEAKEPTGLVRVGFTTTTEGPVLSRLLGQFRARHAACEVTLHETEIFDPYRLLRRGELDVLYNYLPVGEPDLIAGPALERFGLRLAVARGHRLARASSISIEDLADEELARVPSTFPKRLHDLFLPPLLPSGRPTRCTHPVRTIKEVITLVAQGRIVYPVAGRTVNQDRDDIVTVAVRDGPPGVIGLIWRAGHEDARIRALAEIAQTLEVERGATVGSARSGDNAAADTARPT